MRFIIRRRQRQDEQTRTILKGLQGRNGASRAEALARLDEMPPEEAVRVLLAGLDSDRRTRRALPLTLIASFAVMWLFNLAMRGVGMTPSITTPFQTAIQTVVMIVIASNRLRAGSYRALAAYQDARAVDALVTAMTTGPAETRRPARDALTRLLPRLRPADSPHVSRASRHRLNDMLVNNVQADFVLAILASWEQVGDFEAIPYVERLANGEGAAGGVTNVREAARAALPTIRESAKRMAISGVLLRPADSGDDGAALLRPAATDVHDDEHMLLRPNAD
jgi:hypothetical protein